MVLEKTTNLQIVKLVIIKRDIQISNAKYENPLSPLSGQYVYIVAASKEGPVKFGYSSNPEERLRQLQTGSPERLVLLNVRDFKEERFARFAEERIHHELRQFSTYGGYYEWFNIILLRLKWFYLISPFTEPCHSMQTTKDHMKVA